MTSLATTTANLIHLLPLNVLVLQAQRTARTESATVHGKKADQVQPAIPSLVVQVNPHTLLQWDQNLELTDNITLTDVQYGKFRLLRPASGKDLTCLLSATKLVFESRVRCSKIVLGKSSRSISASRVHTNTPARAAC